MSQHEAQIKTFWLVLNYACNNHCKGCYASESGFINQPMSFEDACLIMHMMKDVGALDCLLIGGEPSIYPRVIEAIEYGTSLGLSVKIVTNGRLLANMDFLNSMINAGLKHASVSIEGSCADVHNNITGSNSFNQVITAIDNLVKLGMSFNTLLTINQNNSTELIPLAELLHSNGVKNILFNVGLPSTDFGDASEFVLEPEKVARIIEQSYLYLKSAGIKVKFFATIPLCLIDPEILSDMMSDDYITDGIHCHIFYGSGVAFEPNGNVIPCTHFVGQPLFNIHDDNACTVENFSTMWYGPNGMHGSFHDALWRYPHDNCKTCDLWGKCIGGCPFLWTYFEPQLVLKGQRR